MISIGTIAKTYGVLPSYVRSNGDTFDLMIMDVMVAWEQHQRDKANGVSAPPPDLSEDELLKIFNEARGQE